MVDGFTAAVKRVEAAVASDDDTARSVSIAVAEALMWLDALRQTSRTVGRGHELAAELARDPLVKALTFFRGRLHHHWAPVAAKYDGINWGWLSADNLPLPPDARHVNPEGEKLYRALVEHQPVLEPLAALVERLAHVERP
jgi:hypothetical protein